MKKQKIFIPMLGILFISFYLCGCSIGGPPAGSENNQQTENEPTGEVAEEGTNESNTVSDSDLPDETPVQEEETVNQETSEPPVTNLQEMQDIGTLNADNGYKQIVPVGTGSRVDLNEDRINDSVIFNAASIDEPGQSGQVMEFTINGGDYLYTLTLGGDQMYLIEPNLDWYYITDLDVRDSFKEIAILDYGRNDKPVTHFIRYTGTGTYYLGYVPGFPDNNSFEIHGDGTVGSETTLDLPREFKAPATWVCGSDLLLTSNLRMRKDNIYYPYQYENTESPMMLVKDVVIYEEASVNSKQTKVTASDSPVKIIRSDNYNWIYIEREDDVKGWIFVNNEGTVSGSDSSYRLMELIKNLRQ